MIKTTITRIVQKIKRDTLESSYQIAAFGIFGSISYLLFYFFNAYFGSPLYDSLGLRLVATLLCLALIFHRYWPQSLKKNLPWFWHISLTYCLPFFFSYMLFQNHFAAPWLMNYITVLFLLMLLVDWKSFFVMLFLGIVAALGVYELMSEVPLSINHTPISQSDIIGTFIITIIMGLIFIKGRKRYANENIQALKVAAGTIAHDLRTPLLSIKSIAGGLHDIVPKLMSGYQLAKEQGLQVKPIRKQKLVVLNDAFSRQISEIDFANNYIDLVLGNLKHDDVDTSSFEMLMMSEILTESINEYPYTDQERDLVHLNIINDFAILGDRFYFKNIINNLFRNSFSFIKAEGKGEIFITCDGHVLQIKDTAKGASSEVCRTIFEPYKSNRKGGTGLGLAFCKTIIESFGGSVKVDSVEGEYINFIFSFKNLN